jgi:plasmid stabilization system protein ParE
VSRSARLLLPAEQEMYDAARFYELHASGLGDEFLSCVEQAFRRILETPERWPIARANTRRHIIYRFPYSVLYRIDPAEIVILAVMHQKRHPSYWLSRILKK